jgi:putative two-component system response regulator
LDKPLVLLADDNEATCILITALLQRDFTVEVASDGGEAIEKLKLRKYAAIVLDLLMPVVDGYGVLEFLRTEHPHLIRRVLVVTAALGPRSMERLSGYDVRGVVAKPFEVDALFSAVRECAGDSDEPLMRGPLISGGMLLLIAEVLKRV